jgi:hypothetical protein
MDHLQSTGERIDAKASDYDECDFEHLALFCVHQEASRLI